MNEHLSSEQMAQWATGDYGDEIERHLSQCSICRSETAQFKLALSSFRESAHDWADQRLRSPDQTIRRIRMAPYHSVLKQLPAFAAAALICLLAVFGLQHHRTIENPAPVGINDTALLQSMKQDLSENAPTALAPIETLVSWEGSKSVAMR